MFGVYKCPEKPPMTPNPRHLCQERFLRTPFANSSYKYQKYLYNKNKTLAKDAGFELYQKADLKQLLIIKNQKHNEGRILKKRFQDRVEEKLNEYEKKIDERRIKLNEMLANEEREFLNEIIKQVQTFKDLQYEEKKQKVIKGKARKEKERMDFAKEMKFIQYSERCTEIRPLLSQQKLLEVSAAQVIQREENKNRKKTEIELEHFWKIMQTKQDEAMKDVVEQKALAKLKLDKEYKFFLECQLKEREAFEELRRQEKQRDAEEIEKIKEKIRQDEKAEKEKKFKLKESIANQLNEGVKLREEAIKQQTENELKITRAFEKISNEELRKEEEKMRNKVSTAMRDMQLFSKYKKEMEEQNMEYEKVREEYQKHIMDESKRKYDEEKLKDSKARNNLLQSCISTNAMMIEERRLKTEQLKKIKNEENEFIEQTRQLSNKLNAEAARQKKLAIQKYRSDLDNQVKYAEILKERERAKEIRIMKAAEEEEQKYESIVAEVLGDVSKQSKFHPFKKVIIDEKCLCVKPIY